jgi:hypothetical protein
VVEYPCDYSYLTHPKEITKYIIVTNAVFARTAFGQLQHSPVEKERNLMFENGRPMLFLDKDGEVVCGFLFWGGHLPRNMFIQ